MLSTSASTIATSGTRLVASRTNPSSILLSSSQQRQFSMFRSIQQAKNGTTIVSLKANAKKNLNNVAATTNTARERLLSSLVSSSSKTTKSSKSTTGIVFTKRNFFKRPDPEVLRSGLEPLKRNWKSILGGLAVGTGILHTVYGNEDNFYDKRWIVDCDPDDLGDFYGSENFMDLYCIFPIMITLMMRGAVFDDQGTVHSQGIPFGEMIVDMTFSDSDEDGDGGDSKWFNKRERFRDEAFGNRFLMYDMMTNFGYETLPDGRCMVYHHGEYWRSSLPPITLIMRTVFQIQAWIAAKTTEHHLRYYAFRNDTEIDEKMENDSRHCMICFWVRNYNPFKVIGYMLFDRELDMPNHLKKKRAEQMAIWKAENPDEDEDEEEEEEESEEVIAVKLERKKTLADAAMSGSLPVQRPEILRQITADMAMDKAIAKATLETVEAVTEEDEEDAAMDAFLAKKESSPATATVAKKRMTMRRIATASALKRFQTSLKSGTATDENVKVQLSRTSTRAAMDLDKEATAASDEAKDNFKAIALIKRATMVQRAATKLARKSTMQVKADKLNKAIDFEIKKDRLDNAYGGYR